mmetsp:Transcript_40428/g.116777  ORF Transcript_40428/g.116777 Transcript_40428/m.116777 type:complete len:276 (-) Transcript_40428:11-838(-)
MRAHIKQGSNRWQFASLPARLQHARLQRSRRTSVRKCREARSALNFGRVRTQETAFKAVAAVTPLIRLRHADACCTCIRMSSLAGQSSSPAPSESENILLLRTSFSVDLLTCVCMSALLTTVLSSKLTRRSKYRLGCMPRPAMPTKFDASCTLRQSMYEPFLRMAWSSVFSWEATTVAISTKRLARASTSPSCIFAAFSGYAACQHAKKKTPIMTQKHIATHRQQRTDRTFPRSRLYGSEKSRSSMNHEPSVRITIIKASSTVSRRLAYLSRYGF